MLKKKMVVLLFYILFVSIIFSQNNKSTHQIEQEYYSKKNILTKSNVSNTSVIKPLNLFKQTELSKSVFGYYPDWEYSKSAHLNFDYNLLSHIAVFDFEASSNGAIEEPPGWPWTDFINEAHSNGVKIIMVVVNFNKTEIHNIITDATARWIFVNRVKGLIDQYNLDGVNIDFEGLDISDRGSRINDFMNELTETVHGLSPEKEVSFAAPAVNWGGWNFEGLAASCDYLFVMGYDFFGSWSSTTGPTAPLTGGNYNITNTIIVQYGSVVNNTPEKIILGVPYYGPHWTTENSTEGANVLAFQNAVRFRDAEGESQSHGLKWSSKYRNSWYSYLEGFTNHQVWFDNDSSLGLKYDLAISKNLKGVGMWALGYDGARKELWDLIERKFIIPVSVEVKNKIPNEIILFQNYPNPFNPTTIIKYSIPQNEMSNTNLVQLRIYDVLGKEIVQLVNEEKSTGSYQVEFNSIDLPSGTYFYELSVGSFIQTKKMMLLR